MDPIFIHPFTMQICGPTMSGKILFVKKLFKKIKQMCSVTFDGILFFYGEWQIAYEKDISTLLDTKIEFYEGVPNPEYHSHDNSKKKLTCIDDLYKEAGDSVLNLFTKGCRIITSHHKNISVIFITQNLFYKGNFSRDISLNTNYLIIFKILEIDHSYNS